MKTRLRSIDARPAFARPAIAVPAFAGPAIARPALARPELARPRLGQGDRLLDSAVLDNLKAETTKEAGDMRTEQQMMDLILGYARQDERVRAVVMNGSRTNVNVPKDRFQDYDIVYLVTELDSFVQNHAWTDVFGKRLIMQMPDEGQLFPSDREGRYAYLMQLADGNRIDLTLIERSQSDEYVLEDKLTVVLLDKDGMLPELPPPTDEDYRIKPPTASEHAGCCNEFWWVATYVAKGLWRQEHLYAYDHLNLYVRPMLLTMLDWQVGISTGYKVSTGKNSKYLRQYVDGRTWSELMATCSDASLEGMWEALFAMGELFRRVSSEVAESMGFAFNEAEALRVTAYLEEVRSQSVR
ncbi:aminoglycoside 6-adenylyltransferase [Paenibacillus sp. P22]|uniref:aminoglycoside 6-adenylyltransferase n=1 Tax=Paenibacillus sp. P22 TaxID=483908 RepID=UPI000434967E|nr:Aminoglycoside 6-adenylyltransferase [Paenibacillus sp. P22]